MQKIDSDFAVKMLIEILFEQGKISKETYLNIIKNITKNESTAAKAA